MTTNEILVKWLPFFEELFSKWKVDPDCQQLIYLDFLLYDNEKLNALDESGELRFWICRFIKNYWFSSTSRYYNLYKKKAPKLLNDIPNETKPELFDEENQY